MDSMYFNREQGSNHLLSPFPNRLLNTILSKTGGID